MHSQLPEKVRRKAAPLGEPGLAWLAGLPAYIAEIERRWSIKVGQPFRRRTEAFVAEAQTLDGQDVVLKITIAGIDPTRQELRGAGQGLCKAAARRRMEEHDAA